MHLNIIILKIHHLFQLFLKNKIPVEELITKFEDIYNYEILNLKKDILNKEIKYLLENYFEEISFFSPHPKDHKSGCKSEKEIYESTKILSHKLDKCIELNKLKLNFYTNNNSNKKILILIKNLLIEINRVLYFLENDELIIRDIENTLYKMKKIKDKNNFEIDLEKFIDENLNSLKDLLHAERFSKENPLLNPDPFIVKLNQLKKKLYFYLNPEAESKLNK